MKVKKNKFWIIALSAMFIVSAMTTASARGSFHATVAVDRQKLLDMLTWEHREEIVVKFNGTDAIHRIKARTGETVMDLLEKYAAWPSVSYVEPNYIFRIQAVTPNDIYYKDNQSYLAQIHVDEAWDKTTGKNSVIVAVLDTGIYLNHPDLKNNIWLNSDEVASNNKDDDNNGYVDDVHGYDFVNGKGDPNPKVDNNSFSEGAMNHGTAGAGLIGAVGNNNTGITGVSWSVQLMAVRVMNSDGAGDLYNIAQGIRYAADNGANIINMSLAGFGKSDALNEAIDYAYRKGVTIIVAAGNSAIGAMGESIDRFPTYPACSDNGANQVIAVSALDSNDKKAMFSDYGSKCVDLSAPGVDLYSTKVLDISNGMTELYGGGFSGTSFSAPLVSGIAALMKATNPALTNKQIGEMLISTGENVDNLSGVLYAGKMGVKVNALNAVIVAMGETVPKDETPVVDDSNNNDNGDTPVNPDTGNTTPDSSSKRNMEGMKLAHLQNDTNVYLLDVANFIRHYIPNDNIFYSWGYYKEDIETYTDLTKYTVGDQVKFRDGYLIKGTEAPVYVITENGKRIWITDEKTFLSLGYTWDKIYWISDTEVSLYPKLSDWNITYKHPNGTLIKYQTDARVYLLEDGKKRPFMSENAFLSRGYYFKNVLTVPDTESYPTGDKIE